MPNNTLLEVKDLKMYFENKKGFLGKKIEYEIGRASLGKEC